MKFHPKDAPIKELCIQGHQSFGDQCNKKAKVIFHIVMTFLVWECYGSPKISIKFVKIRQNLLKFVKIH
jgi:hypothetical protein